MSTKIESLMKVYCDFLDQHIQNCKNSHNHGIQNSFVENLLAGKPLQYNHYFVILFNRKTKNCNTFVIKCIFLYY